MMFKAVALAALLAFAAVAADEDVDESDVLVLDGDNFEDTLKENDKLLIEFYAPWCGHCKRLKPEWAQAATALKGVAPLAKVDCTAEKDICSKYGVQGYPTIKWFTGGEASDYSSGRNADAIEKFVKSRMRPAVSVLDTLDAVKDFVGSNDLAFVAFASENPGDYEKTADALRSDYAFALATDASVAAEYGSQDGAGVLFRSFDEPQIQYSGDFSKKDLESFLKAESFPLLGEIGPDNYSKYMDRGLPLLWIAIDPDTDNSDLEAAARAAAAGFKDTASFVTLDGVKFASHIKNLGHDGPLPGLILTQESTKFLFTADEVTEDTLKAFMQDFKDGSLKPHLKSQPVPESQDEPVYVVVGKSFDDVVTNSDKHVLVEFYAPWCGHCKKLEPEYTALAEEWKANSNVVIAKVDATENDAPGVDISGFPTLMLWKSGDTKPITYSGKRTQSDLSEWISKQTGESASAKVEL